MNATTQISPSTRNHFIDLMKCLAMLFVVTYHISNCGYKFLTEPGAMNLINYYLRNIYVCCVPFFLICNGYLLFRHEFNLKRHLIKTIRFAVLTLFWGVVTLLVYDHFYGVALGLKTFLTDLFTWRGGVIHLWYMGALVIIYLLFPVLKYVYDRNRKLILYVIAVTFLFTFVNELINHVVTIAEGARGVRLYWMEMRNWFSMFNPVPEIPAYTLVYFCIGGFLDDILAWIRKFPRWKVNLTAAVCLAVFCGIHGAVFALISMASRNYICPIWYGYRTITGMIVTACGLVLCANYRGTWQPGARLLTWVSKNTLGVYFMHMVLIYTFKEALYTVRPLFNMAGNLLVGLLTLLVCTAVTFLLRKIPGLKYLVS